MFPKGFSFKLRFSITRDFPFELHKKAIVKTSFTLQIAHRKAGNICEWDPMKLKFLYYMYQHYSLL